MLQCHKCTKVQQQLSVFITGDGINQDLWEEGKATVSVLLQQEKKERSLRDHSQSFH